MAEYIEREAISEGIRKYYYKNPPNFYYGEGFDRGLDRAQRAILDAPAAEPQPDGIQFRTVDDLGRICLPKDIRDKLGLKPGTECAVYSTDELTSDEIIVIRRKKNGKTN